jgi:glycosyltransferase involved in cell wall biosynthesis
MSATQISLRTATPIPDLPIGVTLRLRRVDPVPAAATSALELTILMPCLNEASTLASCIHKAHGFLRRAGIAGEVLVADNGSTDGSQEVAARHGARVIRVPEKGYGNALIAGIRAAKGRFVIMGDSDDSYDFSCLDAFVERLRDGAQLVMGNRFVGGIQPGAMPPLHRYLGNPALTALGRLLFGSPCRDFHCGLRAFARDAILGLDLGAAGMEFASEMVVKATLAGLRIAEVPTTLAPDGRGRPPHLRSWRDGWRHLRFLLLFSPRGLFFYPGIVMAGGGLAAMLRLLLGPIIVGGISFDINTLLYAAVATVVGWQSVIFWLCAVIHGMREGILPRAPNLERILSTLSLERGLLASLALLLAGIAIAAGSVLDWGSSDFGALDPTRSMRLVIPAATAMLLAAQTGSGTLFIALLKIRRGRLDLGGLA